MTRTELRKYRTVVWLLFFSLEATLIVLTLKNSQFAWLLSICVMSYFPLLFYLDDWGDKK